MTTPMMIDTLTKLRISHDADFLLHGTLSVDIVKVTKSNMNSNNTISKVEITNLFKRSKAKAMKTTFWKVLIILLSIQS
jgi:hypothetical protein